MTLAGSANLTPMVTPAIYEVTVVPWRRRRMELHIAGVGVTQVRWRWRAKKMARDLIARRTGAKLDQFDLTWAFRG